MEENEYLEFYKAITKDTQAPLAHIHFTAEGEVTFKSLLYIPKVQPSESFNKYGTRTDNIKLYVRRVFITDDFQDVMPAYLNFVRGVVDSDDLPLNVSRETLQQHKLIKVATVHSCVSYVPVRASTIGDFLTISGHPKETDPQDARYDQEDG